MAEPKVDVRLNLSDNLDDVRRLLEDLDGRLGKIQASSQGAAVQTGVLTTRLTGLANAGREVANGIAAGNDALAIIAQTAPVVGALFGPGGALVGAFIGGGIAITRTLLDIGQRAEQASGAIDSLAIAQKKLADISETSAERSQRLLHERNEDMRKDYLKAIADREAADAAAVTEALRARQNLDQQRLLLPGIRSPGVVEAENEVERTTTAASNTGAALRAANEAYDSFNRQIAASGGRFGDEIDRVKEKLGELISTYDSAHSIILQTKDATSTLDAALSSGLITQNEANSILEKYINYLESGYQKTEQTTSAQDALAKAFALCTSNTNAAAYAALQHSDAVAQSHQAIGEINPAAERLAGGVENLSKSLHDSTSNTNQQINALAQLSPQLGEVNSEAEKSAKIIPEAFDRAFSEAAHAISDALTKGGDAFKNLENIGKQFARSLTSEFLQLGVINPLRNWAFDVNAQALWDIPKSNNLVSGSAQSPNKKQVTSSNSQPISINTFGSNLFSGTSFGNWLNTPIFSTVEKATNGMLAGGEGARLASQTSTWGGNITPLGVFGTGLSIANFAMNPSIGSGIGAAGSLLSLLAPTSSAFGPIGMALAIAAPLLDGLFGSDPGPPTVEAGLRYGTKGLITSNSGADNEADPQAAEQMRQAAVTAMDTLLAASGGAFSKDTFSLINSREGGFTYRIGEDWSGKQYGSFDEAQIDLYRSLVAQGAVDVDNALVDTALQNSKATELDEFVADIDLARRIGESRTALDELDTSLTGVERSAKEAAAATYAPAKEELERAETLGLDAEYRTLLEDQFRAGFDTTMQSFSPMENAMATLRGETAALKEAIDDLGLSISDTEVETAQAAKVAALRADYSGSLDATLNTLRGEEWRNNIQGFADAYQTTLADIGALWGDSAQAGAEMAKANEIVRRQFVDLARSGGIAEEALQRLRGEFPAFTDAIDAAAEVARGARAATLGQDFATARSALQPDYQPTATDILSRAGVDPGGPALRWVSEAMASFGANWVDNVAILTGRTGEHGLRRQLETGTELSDQEISAIVSAMTQVAAAVQQRREAVAADLDQQFAAAVQGLLGETEQLADGFQNARKSLADFSHSLAIDAATSPFGPERRRAEAMEAVYALAAKTRSEDPAEALEAMQSLQGAVQTALDASRDVYTLLGPGYALDFETLTGLLTATETVAERQERTQRDQLAELRRLSGVAAEGFTAVETALRDSLTKGDGRDYGTGSQAVLNRLIAAAVPAYQGDFSSGAFQAWALEQHGAIGNNHGLNAMLVALGADPGGFGGKGTWGLPFEQMGPDDLRLIAANYLLRLNGYPGFADGGVIANGVWGRDSVLARVTGGGMVALAGGEGILTAEATAALGGPAVIDRLNRLPGAHAAAPPGTADPGAAALLAENRRLREELRALNRTVAALLDVQVAAGDQNRTGLRAVERAVERQRDRERAA